MTQSVNQPALTPYDTGERCEPKLWQKSRTEVLAAMRDEPEDIGNVDFEDEESRTIVTVHVARNDDGTHTVHIVPFGDRDEISIETHFEDD
ncbi:MULTISPECIES: hypothetical protein [Paenarthrobacter]|uniref:Halobacterial output domain-containing protein n=1 Tax=Paenarthrobacter ureafaciens TaxID=37931 RepID=A0AAX3EDF3_PAEUR|nr:MULTISPECIES: hypothetical protein [Paenarthrobacter]NKR13279.1 hypothetical protein [Arthrobacter sp. M5]NKR14871.1 hypothetical protein [Arthrobacter sp. M6]OEH62422.1 hypothetical protein A5N13_01835 [Arthrobacter sp. D4]OEH62993.1 hypothetical protein A5N17_10075 [Arthrobacter sp. D2]MDO5865172.1 hypothetical protein [Paenarthrobacter sp. SD-2]